MTLLEMEKRKIAIVNDTNIQIASKNNKKFWNFTEAEGDNEEEVELTIYGEIVSDLSWWDSSGEVAANDFMKELDSYKDKNSIIVRINSNGGDVFASAAIYTRLKDFSGSVKVKVDGMCMSAATIVAMAADESEISPCGIFMTHPPLTGLSGYFNSQDLDKYKAMLEKVTQIILNAYAQKTNKSQDELKQYLESDNYMTADEAVENGFIDKVMFTENSDPVIDKNLYIINKVETNLSNMPEEFKNKLKKLVFKNSFKNSSGNSPSYFFNKENEERGAKYMTAQEIKNKYPDVFREIVDTAKKDERERIKAIDDLGPGFENLTNKAKYESCINAGECAVQVLNAQKNQGKDYLENRNQDIKDSNSVDVKPAGIHQDNVAKDGYDYDETNRFLDKALGKKGCVK